MSDLSDDEKLRKLGQRYRRGLAKKYPLTQKQLDAVRQVVRQQWQRDQLTRGSTPAVRKSHKAQEEQQRIQKKQAEEHRKSHSKRHRHSH